MELNKKSIATLGAAAAAIVVLAGGYAVSFANYSSTLEKARIGIEHFVTKSAQVEPGKISVEFFEPKAGLFSHDVTLVITDGTDSFKLPMTIGSGYASYSFELDLVNSKLNQENALKYFELNDLTKLEAYGKVSLISGKLNFTSNISYLNHSNALQQHAQSLAFDLFQKQKAQEAVQKAKLAQAKQEAEAQKALLREKKAALNVTLESNRAKNRLNNQAEATVQENSAALASANISEQEASDLQEVNSVETIKNTPVTADMDTQGAALEAQQELAQGNVSEQEASDLQEVNSVETIKNTPVTADMDTQGAALEAQQELAQGNVSEQEVSDLQDSEAVETIDNNPVTANTNEQEASQDSEIIATPDCQDEQLITITELDEDELEDESNTLEEQAPAHAHVPVVDSEDEPEEVLADTDLSGITPNEDLTVTYKYNKQLSMDENLAALKKMQEMAVLNDQAKNEAKLAALAKEEFEKLVKQVGYKPVGNATINLVIDSNENIQTSINIDNYHKDGVGFTNLNVFSESTGVLSLSNVGRSELSVDHAYDIAYSPLTAFEHTVLKFNGSKPTKSGNFSLDYSLKADTFDAYKYVDISGRLNGLNTVLFNSSDILESLVQIVEQNGLQLSANKNSTYSVPSFVRPDSYSDPVAKDIKVTFDGSLGFPKGEKFYLFFSMPEGVINFNLDTPAQLIADPSFIMDQDIIKGFEVKDGKSYGTVEFVKRSDMPQIFVNGHGIL